MSGSSSSSSSSSAEAKLAADLDAFKREIYADSERIIDEIFPTKVVSLGEIYARFGEGHRGGAFEPPVDAAASSVDGDVSCNAEVVKLLEVLKSEVVQLIDMLGTLKLWVSLNVPRIEDGNNFGVVVQQEIVAMLDSGRMSGVAVLEVIKNYFYRRGKLISGSLKRPGICDYMRNCVEMDEKQYAVLRQATCDLRNNYALLYDKIVKNRDKLVKPKGSPVRSMMY